ncbi:dienelactone hydrolase family protein [Priestia filamentosa]|uniref:dienelactone hydrolase family protein n=1 Tax=Priestia filamentosa TaxID=1402861 RepID=UPI003F1415E6
MKNHDIAIVLVHEIYGVNEHMKYMEERLSRLGIDIICPNLLHEEISYSYKEEEIAYENFTQNIGFKDGMKQVNQVVAELKQKYKRVGVVGFSIGATISWLYSENQMCDFVIGCYGSRIRNYVDVEPTCPTLLIFANEEKVFDVHKLVDVLEKKGHSFLEVRNFEGTHGFMDPFSDNYNDLTSKQALRCIDEFVQKQLSASFL